MREPRLAASRNGNLAPAGLSKGEANDQAKDQAKPGRAK